MPSRGALNKSSRIVSLQLTDFPKCEVLIPGSAQEAVAQLMQARLPHLARVS